MRLRCDSINYYTRSGVDPQGRPTQRSAASVTFSFAEGEPDGRPIDGFSITFIDIDAPIDYFPGKLYDLTLTEVVEN